MDIYDMKPGIRLILPLVLAVAVVSIYGRTLGYDFCRLDDPIYIKNNKWVQSGLSIEGVQKAFTQPLGHVYIPMVALSYMVDVELFGNRPWGFHLTNLVFHLLNTLLLFFIFRKIPELEGPAAVMALLLAVHPIHVESVAWIAERKDVLSAFFFLLTIGAYHRWTLEQSVRLYLLSLLLFLLGLMSKAMLVSLPLCLLLLDFWPLGRLSGGRPGGIDLKLSLKPLLEKVPFFLLAGLFSLATLGTAGSHEVKMGLDLLPLVPRIENALISYTVYLTKLVWPWNLGVLYPHPKLDVSHWQAAASGVFFAVLAGHGLSGQTPGAIPVDRTALVFHHPGPGHRAGSSRSAGHGRPVRLYSFHGNLSDYRSRVFHPFEKEMGEATGRFRGRRDHPGVFFCYCHSGRPDSGKTT